ATTLTLAGLKLASDRCYRVLFVCKHATASAANVSLFYNGDTTATNYYRQTIFVNNATISGARANDGFAFQMTASDPATGDIDIFADFDGRRRAAVRNRLS